MNSKISITNGKAFNADSKICFLLKNWSFDFQKCFIKSKHKICILLENVLMRIYRPNLDKLFSILTFSRISYILFKKLNFLILMIFFLIQTWNIHFIRNYLRQNLYILLKRTILHSYVFFVSHIFCLKNWIF